MALKLLPSYNKPALTVGQGGVNRLLAEILNDEDESLQAEVGCDPLVVPAGDIDGL